jgi:hypothetical protein
MMPHSPWKKYGSGGVRRLDAAFDGPARRPAKLAKKLR